MWKVRFKDSVAAKIKELYKNKKLTDDDREVLASWIKQVSEFGPESLTKDSFWHDHALDSDWKGFRSSSFSYSGRIIYEVREQEILVMVVKLTVDHDYKRGEE